MIPPDWVSLRSSRNWVIDWKIRMETRASGSISRHDFFAFYFRKWTQIFVVILFTGWIRAVWVQCYKYDFRLRLSVKTYHGPSSEYGAWDGRSISPAVQLCGIIFDSTSFLPFILIWNRYKNSDYSPYLYRLRVWTVERHHFWFEMTYQGYSLKYSLICIKIDAWICGSRQYETQSFNADIKNFKNE